MLIVELYLALKMTANSRILSTIALYYLDAKINVD